MKIAIYIINGKILKTTNADKKFKKRCPDKILYQEEFSGNIKEAEAILDKWIKNNLNPKEIEVEGPSIVLHHFINRRTEYTITSIYDNLDNMKHVNDIMDYEKLD